METYLVICPTHRDRRELSLLARANARFLWHDYASLELEGMFGNGPQPVIDDPLLEVERIVHRFAGDRISGVISTDDYPGSVLSCIVARRFQLPSPDPSVNLLCQHKYQSRLAQSKLVPDAVPVFTSFAGGSGSVLLDEVGSPAFLKPIKSFFSIGAQKVFSAAEVERTHDHWASLGAFLSPFESLFEHYSGMQFGGAFLIGERLLSGLQTTVEGYAHGETVHIIGVVDSFMIPDTISFARFEYPSSAPDEIQRRMAAIARRVMHGMGYRDGMFNIEFMYDAVSDQVSIIEINPRMASQFADLYEKVDGTNSYEILLDLARGRKPVTRWRQGKHAFAASCVLRTLRDMHVVSLPADSELAFVAELDPDIRVEILASAGRRLSDEMQDGHSYRYGIINLGGTDRGDVLERLQACLSHLTFDLVDPDCDQDRLEPCAGSLYAVREMSVGTKVLAEYVPDATVESDR